VSKNVQGTTCVVTINNPPVNGLSYAVRAGIVAGIDAANEDDTVTSIVIIGSEWGFSAGADIRELATGTSKREPSLATVIRVIEASTKPVIAAIAGSALGGGLELALACHYRVAAAAARVALPEVKLCLLPGAGGTQRLPRLVGVERALNLILSGATASVADLEGTALFDAVIDGGLLEGAVAFAATCMARPRVRDLDINYPNADGFFQLARSSASNKHLPAPAKCVEAVYAAATKPFEEGLRIEREAFLSLSMTPQSRALRHGFLGARAASRIPDVPADAPTRDIARVAVVGAGTMGRGIAMAFSNAGIPVQLLESSRPALEAGMAAIRAQYDSSIKKGKLTAAGVEERLRSLTGTLEYGEVGSADLVIEAVFEEMAVKSEVFARLDAVMKPGSILASNTSTLDLNRIAGFTRRPGDVVGLHFFSPAHVMRLLEVVRGAETSKDVLATVLKLARKIGKTAVVAGVCDGFIGNRMLMHYVRTAGFLVEEGASPQQVDRALEGWGMAMGPFRMNDLAGLDISWAVRKRRYVEHPEVRYPRFVDQLCAQGRYGQKTGRGWYLYPPGQRNGVPDPEVERMLTEYRTETGVGPARVVQDDEIIERCIYALVNEGARVLQEGIALRASDVDVVFLTGYGFPAHRGGPLCFADEVGLYNVQRAVRGFATRTGDPFWEPAPLLSELADAGKTFN
jgi:3-hydroxyacyl-CoA dehydrogenase